MVYALLIVTYASVISQPQAVALLLPRLRLTLSDISGSDIIAMIESL